MAHLFFAASIQRHIEAPERDVDARTLGEALETVFGEQPRLRGYIVDDQGALRKHLSVFIDGQRVRDRQHLSDSLGTESRVYVMQALSGGYGTHPHQSKRPIEPKETPDMNDRLLVATRKGLFVLHADGNGGWSLGEPDFIGEPVSMALADPRDGTLYAALNLGHFGVKLHRRRAGAAEWEECAVPVYPPQPADPPRADTGAHARTGDVDDAADEAPAPPRPPWTLQQIWSLEAGGADEPGVLWAGTIPGGLFRSGDGGDSWVLNRALWDRPERPEWFGGGYDAPGIHSVMVDPRDSRHVTIGISCGGVWQTFDGGATWRVSADGMEADYMPPERRGEPNVQDPHRVVQCAAKPDVLWTQHHCAIFRSTDGAAHWQRIEAQPSSFGFAVAVHPRDPDTAWFVPAVKDACRIPVNGRFVVTRTRDGGRTFESLSNGLPPAPAYDLVYRHGLAVDDSGARLAMASTTGGLWTSDDGGDHWRQVSAHLPPVYCVRFG